MSDTQTLHFRVGADTGVLLLTIAHEHLLYSSDLDKAMKMFTESLGGEVPHDMALKLLSGEMLVTVDEEEQMFGVVERKDHPELEDIYPKQIDFNKFLADKQKELDKHVDSLDRSLDAIINRFRYKKNYRLDVPIKTMMKYIYGKDEEFIDDIMDDLEYDDDLQQMKSLIRITRDFIRKSANIARMFKELDKMYSIDGMFHTTELTNLAQKVQEISRAEFNRFVEGDDDILNAYMSAGKEINFVLNAGIRPVDILDNYSAGWLSPEGEYYALNGEIANMLHNQIGDALQKKGIVPMYEDERHKELDRKTNPDAWLEQNGWAKIHGNWILYGGMLNSKLDKENIPMTDIQKDMIANYIENCHTCIVKLGFKMERFSVGMFRMMDKIALHKHFDF